jgi:toxin YoeB
MNLTFTAQSWEDYQYWLQTDKKALKRINELIKDALRSPYDGIGKPEPLKQALSGYWSRRITEVHRMVYRQMDSGIILIQLRYHYQR